MARACHIREWRRGRLGPIRGVDSIRRDDLCADLPEPRTPRHPRSRPPVAAITRTSTRPRYSTAVAMAKPSRTGRAGAANVGRCVVEVDFDDRATGLLIRCDTEALEGGHQQFGGEPVGVCLGLPDRDHAQAFGAGASVRCDEPVYGVIAELPLKCVVPADVDTLALADHRVGHDCSLSGPGGVVATAYRDRRAQQGSGHREDYSDRYSTSSVGRVAIHAAIWVRLASPSLDRMC